ncbi:MAG: universal stress protein [Campylobacterales bacterium]|nr:universal stress protein [Campylobacterales bacterium]
MHHFKNILYAMSMAGEETEGLKQALSLARNDEAALKVLALYPALPTRLQAQKDAFEAFLAQRTEDALVHARQIVPAELPELVLEVIESELPLAVGLTRYVIRHEHDLLVKEAEPTESEGFKALDMTLLRKCPSAVWLARPIAHSREKIRVAVAIDPLAEGENARDLSIRLLQAARAVADSCSGTLDIVSFWEYAYENYLRHSSWVSVSTEEIVDTVQSAQADHLAQLKELIRASGIQGEQRIYHLRGEAAERLAPFAKEKGVDIMVMGTVARTGIAGFLIGNTAENVFEKLSCSLLTLKPHGYLSPILAYD